MADTPDFRLYQSNALDVLADLLADELRRPAAGAGLLTPDTILIPQVAMKRWLQATLAQRHGIAANLEFLAPGEFVRRALDANVAGEGEDLDAAALRWRLYAALRDPELLQQPALARIRRHAGRDDPLLAWSLAGELAAVFEKYQAWRRDWLLRWEDGADADDPQAILWRSVAAGRQHRARRIQRYLDAHAQPGQPLPLGLPGRLFAFATQNVSPDVLRLIATQARVGTLHFYVPSPSSQYWGDLQRLVGELPAQQADPLEPAAGDSRLLRAWGGAGRDFMALLGGYELVHPALDVGAWPDPIDAGGALSDSLLRRMQHDILHRRAPSAPLREQLRLDDPSLQVHACHTRLRELQVLHDQLRGLLEDDRFDPPLQPREVAVLAPDIDPYLPYLPAVFGAGEPGQRLPWTVADTSPLADAPLAGAFLALLGLPDSRFGLSEILDLLAAPAMLPLTGLQADDLQRLRTWLHEAGARWGLDARHRQAHDAPNDDAGTWRFAIDRLLLGHASGSSAEIEGVAAWPLLEGGALAALDTVLRLLQAMRRMQQQMRKPMSPQHWREELAGLVASWLQPDPAHRQRDERTIERLQRSIEQFAANAETAGFVEAVPFEVVHAHFSAELGQADTRAPLLTGGISFGRMVPMRLLPFRVICVLGMNDGDYPRNDPAAGLSRLTAELGTGRQRRGDRSVREDDRFLFLQLFTAAQDVFYVSYIGADARDGSVREPSVLVSELLEEAARHHGDAEAAARQLVLRHPLQPFSTAAFGSDAEPRMFSYRQPWHAAAQSAEATRSALPAWFDGQPLPPMPMPARLELHQLQQALREPAAVFLQQGLGLRLDEPAMLDEDIEPLEQPARGLPRYGLQQALREAVLAGQSPSRIHASLRGRGLLPSGELGQLLMQQQLQVLEQPLALERQWRDGRQPQPQRVDVQIDDVQLGAELSDLYPHGLLQLRVGERSGPAVIRAGLQWLLASAAGLSQPLVWIHQVPKTGYELESRPPLPADQARQVLRHLLQLRSQALREPLPFAAYGGWKYWLLAAEGKADYGMQQAQQTWQGSGDGSWAEGDSLALRLAFRGRGVFADDALREQFRTLADAIFGAVVHGDVLPWQPQVSSWSQQEVQA